MEWLEKQVFAIGDFDVLLWMLMTAIAVVLLVAIFVIIKCATKKPKEVTIEEVEVADVEETEVEEETPTVEEVKTPKKPGKYHISKREDGKWQVRRENSAKALKIFDTQAEAIAFAKVKANNQETAIVIHKTDGKIRKQKY